MSLGDHKPLLDWNRDSAEKGCGAGAAADTAGGGMGAANKGGGNDEWFGGPVDECMGGMVGGPDPVEDEDGGGVGRAKILVAGESCCGTELLELNETILHTFTSLQYTDFHTLEANWASPISNRRD